MATIISIADMKRRNAQAGHHWFDRETMRLFRSKIESGEARIAGDGCAYFVTSEQSPWEPRRYTIRRCDLQTGHIHTVGNHGAYATRVAALAELNAILVAMPPAIPYP